MAENHVIPNSFQTPNVIVDRLMGLLTPEEYMVLSYAMRHILGWKDRIADRNANISLSMFEQGFTHNGTTYGGTGLTRPQVSRALKSLVEYGVMQKTGEATKDGQRWALTFDDPKAIKWAALQKRRDAKNKKGARRVEKASKASAEKRTGTTSVPPQKDADQYAQRTGSGTLGVPEVVRPAYTIQTHKHINTSGGKTPQPQQSQSKTESPAPRGSTSQKVPAARMNPMKDAIADAFGWTWERMTPSETGQIQKTARELCLVDATPDDVPRLMAYCRSKFDHFKPPALAANYTNAMKWAGWRAPDKHDHEPTASEMAMAHVLDAMEAGDERDTADTLAA